MLWFYRSPVEDSWGFLKFCINKSWAHLQTNCHDHIGVSFLGLIRLDTRIHKLHELVKDSLQRPQAHYVRKHTEREKYTDAPFARHVSCSAPFPYPPHLPARP